VAIVTVGDFDGVHLGHRALLRKTVALAESFQEPTVAVTFDRNTKSFLNNLPPTFLTDNGEKERLLREEGIDSVFFVSFNDAFSGMSASDFLNYLKSHCGCTHLVGGSDFRFGRGGEGTLTDGVCVQGIFQHVVDLKTDLVKISSTGIRTALADGLISKANSWLGYSYTVSGKVIEGKHLGRTIGFPTVNLAPPQGKILPKNGVYVTETEIDGKRYPSMTNVGVRPTVGDPPVRNVETHLIDADGNFYNKSIRVRFLARLRDERKFSDLGDLMQQLREDRNEVFLWHSRKVF